MIRVCNSKEEDDEEDCDCHCHCYCHCRFRHCHEDDSDDIVRADTSVIKNIVMKRISTRREKRRRRWSRGRGDCGCRIANIL
jgi:hypothetical protein